MILSIILKGDTVRIFWEGLNVWKYPKTPKLYEKNTKQVPVWRKIKIATVQHFQKQFGHFYQILWPSQNILSVPITKIINKWNSYWNTKNRIILKGDIVRIFWEGHKIWNKYPRKPKLYKKIQSSSLKNNQNCNLNFQKQFGHFFKVLWPSQIILYQQSYSFFSVQNI